MLSIKGSSIAASTCAHLLTAGGFRPFLEPATRPPVPTILLSDTALALIRDIFGQPGLFADQPRISRRTVCWGGSTVTLPHGAALASEAQIQATLAPLKGSGEGLADFTIHTASPLPEGELRIFGERNAVAARVMLRDAACADEGRVEAVESGWLFLVPSTRHEGWLLAVGAGLDELLGQSRLIAPVVDVIAGGSAPFLAAPRIHLPLRGAHWLACGSAAIGFDPICGDGTAQSVREAILASAVIRAIAEGGDREALLSHYAAMLIAAMRRHLQLCAQFYASGGQGPWWRAQHEALMEGYRFCTGLLATTPEPRFTLDGFRLVPRRSAA